MRFTLWTTYLYQESAWMQQSRTLYYQSASRTTLLFMMLKQYPFFFSFYGIVEYQRKNQSRCQLCQEGNREWSTVFEGRIQEQSIQDQYYVYIWKESWLSIHSYKCPVKYPEYKQSIVFTRSTDHLDVPFSIESIEYKMDVSTNQMDVYNITVLSSQYCFDSQFIMQKNMFFNFHDHRNMCREIV